MSLLLASKHHSIFRIFSFPSFYPFHRKNETLVSLYLQINSPVSNMVLGFSTRLLSSVFFSRCIPLFFELTLCFFQNQSLFILIVCSLSAILASLLAKKMTIFFHSLEIAFGKATELYGSL